MREFIDRVCNEHEREVGELYNEQLTLRAELQRILELLQTEILPREKQMHDMIERMHQSYEDATVKLKSQVGTHVEESRQKADMLNSRRQQHLDPLTQFEDELLRIQSLLAHQVVAPDIVGWRPPTTSFSAPPAASGIASAAAVAAAAAGISVASQPGLASRGAAYAQQQKGRLV